jgi:hypothetical protein
MDPEEHQDALARILAEAQAAADALRSLKRKADEAREGLDEAKKKPKIADRPHFITIGTSVVTAGLTIWALWFTSQSLKTSRTTLEVGQRAYVSVSDSNLLVDDDAGWIREDRLQEAVTGKSSLKPGNGYLSVAISFVIHNLGNTPAAIKDVRMTYHTQPGWTPRRLSQGLTAEGNVLVFDHVNTLGPKDSVAMAFLLRFELERAANRSYRMYLLHIPGGISNGEPPFLVDAVIHYNDVFKVPWTADWCMVLGTVPGEVISCDVAAVRDTTQKGSSGQDKPSSGSKP